MDVRETGNHVARAERLLAEARIELEQWNDDPGRGNADLLQLDEKIERATIILNEARLALDRVANAFPTGLIPITRARGWGGRRDRF
jgi:hypothetical protein